MRKVFCLVAVTLVATALTTAAVASYVNDHPSSILAQCMTRVALVCTGVSSAGRSDETVTPRTDVIVNSCECPAAKEMFQMSSELASATPAEQKLFADAEDLHRLDALSTSQAGKGIAVVCALPEEEDDFTFPPMPGVSEVIEFLPASFETIEAFPEDEATPTSDQNCPCCRTVSLIGKVVCNWIAGCAECPLAACAKCCECSQEKCTACPGVAITKVCAQCPEGRECKASPPQQFKIKVCRDSHDCPEKCCEACPEEIFVLVACPLSARQFLVTTTDTCEGCSECSGKKAVTMVRKMYPVRDLLDYDCDKPADSLVAMIKQMVAPQSWGANGVCVEYFAAGKCLVVRQTAGIHEDIEAFLGDLQTAAEEEIARAENDEIEFCRRMQFVPQPFCVPFPPPNCPPCLPAEVIKRANFEFDTGTPQQPATFNPKFDSRGCSLRCGSITINWADGKLEVRAVGNDKLECVQTPCKDCKKCQEGVELEIEVLPMPETSNEPSTPEELPFCEEGRAAGHGGHGSTCPHAGNCTRYLSPFQQMSLLNTWRWLDTAKVVEILDDSWISDTHAEDWKAHRLGQKGTAPLPK